MSLLHTPVCELLGCDEPVVLSGLGGVARAELVAAVSEAGGFGFLGMVREPPALIEAEIARVRAATGRPFGVNLIPAATAPALLEAELATVLAAEIAAVMLFWDLRADVLRRLRDARLIVVCQVGSALEARQAVDAGAQVVVAQGVEAGGHVRGRTPLLELLPAVLEAVTVPVLAAGGIVDGAQLAQLMTMGAQGAVLGTAFMATRESYAHDYHKARLLAARAGDTVHTEAFHINWPRGAPVRVLANSVTRGERGDPFNSAPTVIGDEDGRPIHLFSTDSPLRNMRGDFEAMALYAGQGVGALVDLPPAAERLQRVVDTARDILAHHNTTELPCN